MNRVYKISFIQPIICHVYYSTHQKKTLVNDYYGEGTTEKQYTVDRKTIYMCTI